MLIDVLNLIGRGGLAEIRCTSKEVDTGLLWKSKRCRHGRQKQASEVVHVDTPCQVADDLLHAGWPVAFFGTHQGNGFTRFVGHEVTNHANGFGKPNGEIGGHLSHFFKGFGFDPRLDSLSQQPRQFGRRGVLPFVVQLDPSGLDVYVW